MSVILVHLCIFSFLFRYITCAKVIRNQMQPLHGTANKKNTNRLQKRRRTCSKLPCFFCILRSTLCQSISVWVDRLHASLSSEKEKVKLTGKEKRENSQNKIKKRSTNCSTTLTCCSFNAYIIWINKCKMRGSEREDWRSDQENEQMNDMTQKEYKLFNKKKCKSAACHW